MLNKAPALSDGPNHQNMGRDRRSPESAWYGRRRSELPWFSRGQEFALHHPQIVLVEVWFGPFISDAEEEGRVLRGGCGRGLRIKEVEMID